MKLKMLKLKIFPSQINYRKSLVLTLLISLLISSNTTAKTNTKAYTLADERGQFLASTDIAGWDYHKELLGLPHVFLKASKRKKHSSFSVTFTGHKIVLKEKKLKSKVEEYTQGRKAWAKKKKVKIKKFHKYKYLVTKNKMRVHILGYEYSTPFLKNMKEKSIYLNCPDDSLIHFKLLLLPEHYKEENKIMKFIDSIVSCKLIQT